MKFTEACGGLIPILQTLCRDCFVSNGRIHLEVSFCKFPRFESVRSRLAISSSRKTKKAIAPIDQTVQPEKTRWTFLTNHAHVLILLAQDSSVTLRQVALKIGITERAVQRIIADLEQDGFIEREKVGRRNHYRILDKRSLRHPIESHRSIGDLIALIGKRD